MRRMRISLAVAFLLFLPLCVYARHGRQQAAPVQQPASQPEPGFRLSVRVERVDVDVAVLDSHGRGVAGLSREQFRVRDNGAEQPITDFSPVEAPAHILLVVETSPAVYFLSSEHQLAAMRLLDGLSAADLVALGTYDESFHPVVAFTQNRAAVAGALGQLQFSLGMARLNLFGSLSTAIQEVRAALEAAGGRMAIVLLSTGLSDVQTESERRRLAADLQVSGVFVYTIALGGNLRSPGGKSGGASAAATAFQQADRDLRAIAESSGGRAYIPRTEKELLAAYSEVTESLRHLYSLAFVPPAHDGKVHVLTVEVTAAGRDGWQIVSRPAYVAPAE